MTSSCTEFHHDIVKFSRQHALESQLHVFYCTESNNISDHKKSNELSSIQGESKHRFDTKDSTSIMNLARMKMNEYLYGKSAIITGASSGIGREVALAFTREGVNVLAIGRRKDRLDDLVAQSYDHKGKMFPYSVDLCDRDSSSAIVAQATGFLGTIDFLINNAAVGSNNNFESIDDVQIDQIIQTNLLAPISLTRKLLPEMLRRQSGHIIFVTSLAGKLGFPGLSVYSATKFAIEGLAESIRREIGDRKVAVTVLRPGATDTEFFEKSNMQEYYQKAKDENRLHPASLVASELTKKIHKKPIDIVVGSDKWYLRIMPFIPEHLRLTVLNMFK